MTVSDVFANTSNLAIVMGVGGVVLIVLITSLADAWRKARIREQNAVLKQQMIDKGFSVDDIERVLAAGPGRKAGCRKACGKKPEYSESA